MNDMNKLDVTSTAFYYIVKELRKELVGGYVNNIQLVNYSDDNLVKIKVHKQKTKELIITPQVLFLTELVLPVNPDGGGLIKFLKKKLYNQRIQEINQDKNNRVVYFKLDDYYLIFEFFSNSNIVLTDSEFNIVTSKQKEEWKDRIIKKHEKYVFPQGKSVFEIGEKELLAQTKALELKECISYFVKEYNVYSGYINQAKDKKEIIKTILELYSLENAKLLLKETTTENKWIVIVIKDKEKNQTNNFFKEIANHYVKNIQINDSKENNIKKNKQESIKENQLNTRKEYEKIAKNLQLEGEVIYQYFQVIEKINEQIRIAREKKVSPEEIIKKINNYLSDNYKQLNIKSIDTKERSYILEIK